MDEGFASELEASVEVVGDSGPDDPEVRRVVVFEADPSEVAAKASKLGEDVIVEAEVLHHPSGWDRRVTTRWLPIAAWALTVDTGVGSSFHATVVSEQGPVEGCEVTLYVHGWSRSATLEAVTDSDGRARFEFGSSWRPTALVAVPAGGYWAAAVRRPVDGTEITLLPLPADGPLAWWHEAVGVREHDPSLGAGMRVGVIDTGVSPNAHLSHVHDVGAFDGGGHDAAGGADVDVHGSLLCGTIGARPDCSSCQYVGIAPGAEVFSARVFLAGKGANQGDIASAIDYLSLELRVDLISLGLGAIHPSQIALDAILSARDEGTLCFCAAGNSDGPVQWPARFGETVGVAALGRQGWAPEGTLSAMRYPSEAGRYGRRQLYLANFSCYGDGIDCCAPGVGVIATAPERFGLTAPSMVMDGTSMASAVACGALAASLSNDDTYGALPRDATRVEYARCRLRDRARDIGLAPGHQGFGVAHL